MKNDSLRDKPFSYGKTKEGQVRIFQSGQLVKTIRGKAAIKFLSKVELMDDESAQLLMAKETGQFKFGNEKIQKKLAGGK